MKEQLVVRNNMDVNEHERYIKVKEHLVARKDMDVNEHEGLSNITPKRK